MNAFEHFENFDFKTINKRSAIFFKYVQKFTKEKDLKNLKGIDFVEKVTDKLNTQIEFDEEELQKIPKNEPFIIVSNFPYGGLEAFILIQVLNKIRSDFKVVGDFKYYHLPQLNENIIPFNPNTTNKKQFISCTKKIFNHISNGGCLVFFPALHTSSLTKKINNIVDVKWDKKIIRIIKKLNVNIVPIYFNDTFGKIYNFLGTIHPIFQTFLIEKQIKKIEEKTITLRIGNQLKFDDLKKFSDSKRFTRFLRAKIYILGAKNKIDLDKFYKYQANTHLKSAEEIVQETPSSIIEQQIEAAKQKYLLYSQNNFEIICAPTNEIPDVLTEIGRLREITFRAVGEGTNKSLDLDEYDIYFNHLVIWDNENKKIVGAYRIGLGDQIIERHSIYGFYISSLFKFSKKITPILSQSLEMGRSFITQEYQRKPLSLFMLWKGILFFLLKNPQYRYLLGPVSISQSFTELSKNLIVQYFSKYHWDPKLAKLVKPRKNYKLKVKADKKIMLEDIGNDINKLDKYIQEIEPGSRIPVLFKKYMGLGAKTIAFNVDPLFNNCLDGLMVFDIFDVPIDTLKTLAKDLNDEEVLKRFNITT